MSQGVLLGTLVATWIGTGSLFANAEKTYEIGLPALWIPLAGGLGILALAFLAARVRRMEVVTIQDILEARFGARVRVLATLALLAAYVIIVSYQYRAGAVVLGYLVPDWSGVQAMVLVATFVIVYTALAGMFSVAYTDVANGLLMLLGVGIALPILWSQAGGWSEIQANFPEGQGDVFGFWTPLKFLGALLPPFLFDYGGREYVPALLFVEERWGSAPGGDRMFFGVLLMEIMIISLAGLGAHLVRTGEMTVPESAGQYHHPHGLSWFAELVGGHVGRHRGGDCGVDSG